MLQPLLISKHTRLLLFLLVCSISALAQPDFVLPLAKPDKYKDKILGAEKTEDKKFTIPRRLFQGMITHYNYYYNAQTKIQAVVQKAKLAHRDDYTELLPFYNFSTEVTAGDSLELDSVLYKSSAGIVLHDLRNSYIDNLYLLIGQSYFYWRKFDSAYRIFQFINYNFFPKDKDEYFIVVGSNSRASNGELNIGTQEKKGIVRKAFSKPPSRNEALLWLAKTYAEDSLYAEAYSLVGLLRKDKLFPKRLHSQLDEVLAYVFYQQEQWDSTAFYLRRALVNAPDKTELARWEYLLAQLYTRLRQPGEASAFFNKAKAHTTDPVMYIHARIYEAQLVQNGQPNSLQQTLQDLLQLSKKERFDGFEDVLYYAASGIALEQGDTTFARRLLQKSTSYPIENSQVKNKAFLKMATLAYMQRDYEFAAGCFDSLNLQDPFLEPQAVFLDQRKTMLKELVRNIKIVQREDSLQQVARMPETEREAYLKALVKKLRKQKGLKEEAAYYNTSVPSPAASQDFTLFSAETAGTTFYFNNAGQRSKGSGEFKARWGNRPNADNWRRQSALDDVASGPGNVPGNPGGSDVDKPGSSTVPSGQEEEETELTVDGLLQKLPLTEELMLQSNQKILEALFEQGQIYKNQLEDYKEAARVFEEIWKRFSNYDKEEETLFELYYCNLKAGNKEKALYFQSQLQQKFPAGEAQSTITAAKQPKGQKDAGTQAYETIYNNFIEGNFAQALTQKAAADSVYGSTYWTPQLLYIESVYHIRQKNDSVAMVTLTNIESKFPGTPMAEKAAIMKDVLGRRSEIESYLTTTNIVRQTEDALIIPFDEGPTVSKTKTPVAKTDTLNKVTMGPKPAAVTPLEKPKAPVQKVGLEQEKKNTAGKIQMGNKPVTDTTGIKPLKNEKVEMAYLFNANEPYVVLMYFDKVDPIYISESKVALQRYNNSAHSGENIQIQVYETQEEFNWMEVGPYPVMASALSYFDELKANSRQIVPWLPAEKYNFIIISEHNLDILKSRKNMEEYKLFIRQYIKDKF